MYSRHLLPLSGVWLLLAPLALAQTIEWTARFDDVRPGYDSTKASVRCPGGEIHVLAERTHGTVLFSIDPGDEVAETPRDERDEVYFNSLAASPDGSVYLGALRRDAAGRYTTAVLLRRSPGAQQWDEFAYSSSAVWLSIETISADPAGNILLSGSTTEGTQTARLTCLSFDPQGALRWTVRFEDAVLLATAAHFYGGIRQDFDALGNAYVAAPVRGPNSNGDSDLLILRIGGTGAIDWTRRYSVDPAETFASIYPGAVLVDGDAVFVCTTMWVAGPVYGFVTLKADLEGTISWSDFVTGRTGFDVRAARCPIDGGIYVAATVSSEGMRTHRDPFLARYTREGTRLFEGVYDGGSEASELLRGITVDEAGRAYLGGHSSYLDTPVEARVIQVLPDGSRGWDRRYPGPFPDGYLYSTAFLADGQGRPTVIAAVTDPHTSRDALLLSVNPDGELAQVRQLDSTVPSHESFCYGNLADALGNLYVLLDSDRYSDEGGIVLVKYDSEGVELWRRRIAEPGSYPCCMVMGPFDEPIVVGNISENEPGIALGDIIVVSFAADGSERWRYRYEGPTDEWTYAIDAVVDSNGALFVTGATYVGQQGLRVLLKFDYFGRFQWDTLTTDAIGPITVDSQGNPIVLAQWGVLLAKYSADGVLQWRSWGDECWVPADLATDRFGNIVAVGRGCFTSPAERMSILKFDSQGELLWAVEPNEAAPGSLGRRVVVDRSGDIFASGISNNSGNGLIACRVSRDGELRWIVQRDMLSDAFWGIAVDADWVYLAGRRSVAYGDYDAVALRYDHDGHLAWRGEYSGPGLGEDRAQAITLDADGRLCLSGRSRAPESNDDIVSVCYGAAPPPCGGTPACRAADVNADCVVDLADLFIVLSNFGLTHRGSISPADGDINFDGATDLSDLVSVLGAFGLTCE